MRASSRLSNSGVKQAEGISQCFWDVPPPNLNEADVTWETSGAANAACGVGELVRFPSHHNLERRTALFLGLKSEGSAPKILMKKEFINPPTLPDWKYVFSQVIAVPNHGKTIYISGQVAVDADKNLIGNGDLKAQALQSFHNVQLALASAGATTADVVKVTIYVRDYQRKDAAAISEAFRQYFPFENLPTATWIGVQSLAEEGFLIEVEAIAVVA